MIITLNILIEIRNKDLETIAIERVLWISPDLEDVVLFNIDKELPHAPILKSASELEEILSTPYASVLKFDPYKTLNAPEQDFLDKHKKRRDIKWEIIKDYIENEPNIYDPELLKAMISEMKSKTGKSSKRIYSILREYWRGGKTINALMPNYGNSGGRGKPKQLKDKKIGRPSKLFFEKGIQGVNVTDADKELFQVGIKHFYRDKKTTLKKHMMKSYKSIILLDTKLSMELLFLSR